MFGEHICMFILVCVGGLSVYRYICTWRPELSIYLNNFSLHVLRQGVSLEPELAHLASLGS